MKFKIIYIVYILAFFECCSPATVITATWKSPQQSSTKYSTILVAALTYNTIAKTYVESDLAVSLGTSVTAIKSIDELPPDISNSDTDKVTLMNKVKNKNIDAILTISLISKETESRYISGANPYNPLGYSYYDSFWGYYNYWHPYMYNQGYYIQDRVYYIESNLYDVSTEKLMWSAQSKTYNPDNLKFFSKEFSEVIATRLRTDGIINMIPPKDNKITLK